MKLLLVLALLLAIWGTVAWALKQRYLATVMWAATFFTLVVIASLWH